MEKRSVSCIVILLLSLVVADARIMEPVSTDETCDKCLLVSRKAEAALNSQILFYEAHKLSQEACHIFPTILQDKCLKKSGAYLHEARLILQQFFEEDHLCNSTGLCVPSVDNYPVMNGFDDELQDERGCAACRKAGRELLNRLKQPKNRSKIVEALLDYCEEADEGEDQCKKAIHKYGPMIMKKIEKFKPSELCSMIKMCDEEEEISMKI